MATTDNPELTKIVLNTECSRKKSDQKDSDKF